MTRAVIYRHDERPNSSNHKLFPRASTNHSSTSGPRKTDRKRLCVAYSYEMVEPRGKGCVRKGRSTSDPVPARSTPPQQQDYHAYKVLKGRSAAHQGRGKKEVHDHKSFRASRPSCLVERRRQHSYGHATNDKATTRRATDLRRSASGIESK